MKERPMTIRRRCTERKLQGRTAVPRAPAVRRDVARQAISHAGERIRDSANGTGQATSDPVDGGGSRLGTAVHRRNQGGSQSATAAESIDSREHGNRRRLGVPRRLSGTLRQAGRAAQHQVGAQPDRGAEGTSRGTCRCRRWRSRTRSTGSRPTPTTQRTWRSRRSTACWRRLRAAINWGMAQTPPLFAKSPFHRFGVRLNKKAETVRDRRLSRDEEKRLLDTALAADEHGGAPVRRRAAARPDHRRAGALLPPRRDAADPEQARELGHLPDRHPRRDGEGQGEPPNPVQPQGTAGGHPQAPRRARARRLRLRQHQRSLPADDSDGLGNAEAARATASSRSREERERNGTGSNCNASTCGGTTCGTRAPVDCWRTAWTSGSFS